VAINHGTRGGYYAHRRLKEGDPEHEPCDACREAINEYVREYRAKNGLARNRFKEGIRRKALAALRDRHRKEYDTLVAQFEADALEDVL
jgi:hypothetical protein